MPPQTHYAKSGEVNIAYQVVGDGPLDLVFVPGFISHLDLQWADPRIARFLEKLASFSRLIMFDKRGTGLSDPVAAPAPLEDRMDDVRAVMDAAGSERAALFGLSEGGAMSVLFAATYPERTRALLLCGTFPNGTLDPDDNPGGQRWVDGVQRVRSATEHWGEGRTLAYMAPSADSERDRIGRGIFERSAASPQMAQTLIDMVLETDVRELLPTLRVPTLVLHRAEEFVPVECARYMAERIPGARLVVLPGMDHIPFYGDADGYAEEIEEFLTGARQAPISDRILTTVMFTDIVGSTERAAALGDARWRELISRHDELMRAELERHRGHEVKTMGDGFLATFDGPARGIRCARAVADQVRSLDMALRAGLHTGECELIGDDIGGMAVNIGARIGALAGADEVVVSSTVKDLVVGSGISFSDRGTSELKGVPGEWRLFAVDQVEAPPSDRLVPDTRERLSFTSS
ncbi:MAG: adenylate/guanylate cyclase domain-containing protein [Actinobacteria bacterium]|nr:MAG: adenylate/guanylate cyclase domain-containing protein [Actinomycetota bacterium]